MNERMIDKYFADKGYTECEVEEIKMNLDKRTAVNFRRGVDEIDVGSVHDGYEIEVSESILTPQHYEDIEQAIRDHCDDN